MSNDPLAALMDSSWGLASPRVASQSGKLGGAVGGFQVGLPAANQARVGLLCLEYSDMEAALFCGASIGRGGKKMCTKSECNVISHTKMKVGVEEFGGSAPQVFIRVPPTAGKTEPTAVYLTPRVSTDAFDARLEMYLAEERTVDQWTSFFASLEATPNPTAEEREIIAGRFEQTPPPSAFTPRAGNKLGKRKAESPLVDPDTDFSFLESTFATEIPQELGGGTLADELKEMAAHWGELVGNTNTLLRFAQMAHQVGREDRERAEIGMADIEFATSLLATKVGDRPASLGTESLFKLMEELVEDVTKVQKSVAVLESADLAAVREQQLTLTIAQDIMSQLNPFFRLFGLLSRSKDTPGDLLEERLRSLEATGTQHQAGPARGTTASTGPWFTTQMKGLTVGGGTAPLLGDSDPTGMAERIKVLEAQIKDMQDEMAASSVQMGTVTFVSRSHAKAWMDLNRCPPRTCIFFLDALSMLALMHSGSESAKAAAEFASITKKVGYETTDEALVVTSFNLELPEAFGTLPKSGIARDSRVLPALPTFQEWDGGDGYLGLRVELAHKLNEFLGPMGQHYRNCLTGEALIIANEMLAASKLFISDLSTWINTTFQDTRARTMASEKEAWSLISHCVRVIFKLLRDARAGGARWTPETRDVQLVWAQIQCHRVMSKLRLAQFSAHPALSHVLNLHLQDNVVSRSKYEAMEKRMLEIEKVARDAKKVADKLASAKK